ncbi:MAG TPA: ATP-binding protein [Nocardioidaceae bacterium]|jgi:anti-sigma regulatory factor (Ser/Thr protein kinase)|nr:ATP-binding protein [Nocardioidaceae bacterium]
MATVALQVGQDPAHVRLVRLVSSAVARMAGLGDEALDEVRLGVSEACGLAIDALGAAGSDAPMSLEFDDTGGLRVTVRTPAALPARHEVPVPADPALEDSPNVAHVLLDRLALIEGLIDDVDVASGPDGSSVTMRWKPESGTAPGK